MIRQVFIIVIVLAVLAGSLVTAGATLRARDETLRGYVDPTQDANLPYRIPRLGVNAELTQYTADELAHQLDLMRQAHVTWVRQAFRWSEIEPQPGVFHWGKVDAIVQHFAAAGDLKLVAVLVDSPAWARTSVNPSSPPTNPSDYANFTAAFAQRYGTTVDYYQLWDEPNLASGWGDQEPSPAAYLALLQAGFQAIHGADSQATVIAAGLAPTIERGPENISDLRYLSDLYALGAADYMDAVAAKPYGFDASPEDRTVQEDTLNFSRIVALREIMTLNGDGKKALWASAWGWNTLPDDWNGEPSIWGSVTPQQQVAYTLDALTRADREWAWMGGMILYHWQPNAPSNDPRWGFSMIDSSGEPTPLWKALAEQTHSDSANNGLYFPANDYANYSGVWTFGELGADIGWVQDSQLSFTYRGSDLALLTRQDDYVAFLYATVDGEPANALPRDASGNAVLNLTSDTRLPEIELVPIAHRLGEGEHILRITADRGWDRWALAGFAVSSGSLAEPYNRQIAIALFTAIVSALAATITVLRFDWSPIGRRFSGIWRALGNVGQIAVSIITSLALMVAMLLTWSDAVPGLFRREPVQLALALLTAGLIYVEPHLVLLLLSLIVLFVIIYNRLELGLILTILYAPFFLFPINLYSFAFPMSEMLILITAAVGLLKALAAWGRARQSGTHLPTGSITRHLNPLDYTLAVWILLGALSLLWAEHSKEAVTEFRVMMVEPVLFYILLRAVARDRSTLLRLTDALLVAGFLVAIIGLYQFARGEAIITAEEGARRLASVYGSPNNVGLFLGRCIPFLLAFAILPLDKRRRIFAGILFAVLLFAVILSQSAGALLLGVPASIAVVLILALGKRGVIVVGGLAVVSGAAVLVAMQSARFARILNFTEGTSFFRLRVWESAVQMILDHPITGLGLDQFLYAYRGRYILPDAWQEPNLSHPHNVFLDFWVRLGIFGLIVFLWIQAIFWRQSLRLYRTIRSAAAREPLTLALVIGMMGSMINLLAHGLVDNSIYVNDLAYVFMLLLGLCANLAMLQREETL